MSCLGTGLKFPSVLTTCFFLSKNRICQVEHRRGRSTVTLVCRLLEMSPARTPALPPAKPASLWVVSCQVGAESSNCLLAFNSSLFFSGLAVAPSQSGHLLPFCFSATEATNTQPAGRAGLQTCWAGLTWCLHNKHCQLLEIGTST